MPIDFRCPLLLEMHVAMDYLHSLDRQLLESEARYLMLNLTLPADAFDAFHPVALQVMNHLLIGSWLVVLETRDKISEGYVPSLELHCGCHHLGPHHHHQLLEPKFHWY
jgi:hypothetical protein